MDEGFRLHKEVWSRIAAGANDFTDLCGPDFTLEVSGFPQEDARGVPTIVAAWRTAFSNFGRIRSTIHTLQGAEGDFAVEHSLFMTHDGDFPTPTGEIIPATGRKVTVRSVDIFTIDSDGKLANWRVYTDYIDLLKQLQG